MNIRSWIKKHALPVYFVLAYGISWGASLLVAGTARFTGQALPFEQGILMLPMMLLGPSLSGILLTALLDGRAGLRELLAAGKRVRVGAGWYAALLANPLLVLGVLLGLAALVSPDYLPGFMPLGILYGLLAGFFEEIGWTGFATPRLLAKYPLPKAGLILGLLWGTWHLMAGFLGSAPGTEGLWLREALVFWVGGLAAYRVLMTWVYAHTRSLLLGQLMHLVFTGVLAAFVPSLPIQQSTVFYLVQAGGLALLAGALLLGIRARRIQASGVQV